MVVLVVTMTAAACSRGGPAMNLPSVAREVGPAMTRIVAEKDDKDEDTMVKTEGSGMVLTPSGEVLTNAHVVERGFAITAAVPGSATPHPVAILGMDLAADVALVRVLGASGLPTVRVAGSPQVPVGEEVAAVGYPQGRTSLSVARGRVVGQGRTVVVSGENGLQGLHGVLQIDAPVAPGDSGSALADSSGQVVGMITAGVRGQAGYALPIRTVMGVVDRIRSGRGGRDIVLGLQP
ncbi:MAG TPA: serine protease [Candidatus Dormibacteraeota bacterium]|nr:serine protease [Candidatus Dormibacteraeota bacterium]